MSISDSLKNLQSKFILRKDAEISGTKFTLQVLAFKDERKIQSLPTGEEVDGVAFFNEMQKGLLSYAIRAVDGDEIPETVDVVGSDGAKSTKERAIYMREVLESLPSSVIDHLFQAYVDLRDQKENEVTSSLSYKWYKTPEQRDDERRKREAEILVKDQAAKSAAAEEAAKSSVPSPDADIKFTKLPDQDETEGKPAGA